MLVRLWANQIIDENKTIENTPKGLRNAVEQLLIDEGYSFLLS